MATPTRLTIAAAALLLAACATPYKPDSTWNGGGYGQHLEAPNVYQVWFHGNTYTTEDRSEELATLRAAEVCLGDGKPFMRASNYQTRSDLSVVTPPVSIMKSVPVIPTYGNPPSPVPTVVGYRGGGNRYDSFSGLKVECLADKGEDAQEAAVVAKRIRERYKLTAGSTPQAASR